jgi:predicted transcriptional regulator of viral defense system
MRFLHFKEIMKPFTLFSLRDIRRIDRSFHRGRLNDWQDKGYIRKLIKGHYMFTDIRLSEAVLHEIANRLYDPSYISCETALAWYGLIPESVYLVVSVGTRKTCRFKIHVAEFSYRTIKPSLFWGYTIEHLEQVHFKIAQPEKAILDFFYLHPSWTGDDDFRELRIDRERFNERVNSERLLAYLEKFSHGALSRRIKRLLNFLSREEQDSNAPARAD